MLPDVKQKINNVQSSLDAAANVSERGNWDLAGFWVGHAQTEALLLIAQQLGELIGLVSAIGVDLTTSNDLAESISIWKGE